MKYAKEGSKPEPKELEHGVRVIADRIFARIPMLFISKPDRIVARHNLIHEASYRTRPHDGKNTRHGVEITGEQFSQFPTPAARYPRPARQAPL